MYLCNSATRTNIGRWLKQIFFAIKKHASVYRNCCRPGGTWLGWRIYLPHVVSSEKHLYDFRQKSVTVVVSCASFARRRAAADCAAWMSRRAAFFDRSTHRGKSPDCQHAGQRLLYARCPPMMEMDPDRLRIDVSPVTIECGAGFQWGKFEDDSEYDIVTQQHRPHRVRFTSDAVMTRTMRDMYALPISSN